MDKSEVFQIFKEASYNTNSSTQVAQSLIDQLDINHDGYISMHDFQRQVGPGPQHQQQPYQLQYQQQQPYQPHYQQQQGHSQVVQQMVNSLRTNLQQTLEAFDRDNNRILNRDEVIHMFLRSNYDWNSSVQMAQSLFDQLDSDHNGQINVNDFQSHLSGHQTQGQLSPIEQQVITFFRTNLQQAIYTYDFNNNGMLD